jgi:hypothetical protein
MVNVSRTSFSAKKRQLLSAAAIALVVASGGAYAVQRSEAEQVPAASAAVSVVKNNVSPV